MQWYFPSGSLLVYVLKRVYFHFDRQASRVSVLLKSAVWMSIDVCLNIHNFLWNAHTVKCNQIDVIFINIMKTIILVWVWKSFLLYSIQRKELSYKYKYTISDVIFMNKMSLQSALLMCLYSIRCTPNYDKVNYSVIFVRVEKCQP